MRHRWLLFLIPLVGSALAACDQRTVGSTTQPELAAVPPQPVMNSVPLGAPPGAATTVASIIRNPYEGDATAVQQGKTLYGAMNCAYCHGGSGTGLIGPDLNKAGWRYGGTPAELYNSIHDGRPKGMPAWGARLPPRDIWKLVTFIESLGGATGPATQETAQLGPGRGTPGKQPADQASAEAQMLVEDQPVEKGERQP